MSFGFKADPSGLYGTVTIDGVDSLVINKDGSIVGNNFVDSNGQLLSVGATNHIIDGDFNFWYEGDSQTSNGYGSDTMWNNINVGTTKVHSKQDFTNGQTDVPGNPKFFSRTVVSSIVGNGNHCAKIQKREGVEGFSGKKVTFSFWAKADSTKNIAIEFVQTFGSGGAPSSDIKGIGSQLVPLTTTWTEHKITIDIPSIASKVIGDDSNDSLNILFWFDAGSDLNSRTASLGQQSGTFDIARVRLVEGEADGDNINESYTDTLSKIGRYYQTTQGSRVAILGSSYIDSAFVAHLVSRPTEMRTPPTTTIVGAWAYQNCDSGTVDQSNTQTYRVHVNGVGITTYVEASLDGVAAYLTFDSRL